MMTSNDHSSPRRAKPEKPRGAPASRPSRASPTAAPRPGPATTSTLVAALAFLTAACGGGEAGDDGAGGLTGSVSIDGSSTVFPVTQAMAEEFMAENPDARVTVGISGTGGGFKKFCAGETDISDASREIAETELEQCRQNDIEPIQLSVAFDGITVAVNPENHWAQCVTVEELRNIWKPGSTVTRWNDVRPDWPDREMPLYGPGTDSGTFDYFTETIVGESGASRGDFTASEDDNVLVMGIARGVNALGYFGFAYYEENRNRLKALEVDGGDGCVAPTRETIEKGSYAPLSRPLFIYVKDQSLRKQTVARFVEFYMENGRELVPQVGYIPLSEERYREQLRELDLDGPAADMAESERATGGGRS